MGLPAPIRFFLFLLPLLMIYSCSSYYRKNQELMEAVDKSDFKKARRILANDQKFESQKRNRLLFYFNKGTVLWMNGEFDSSLVYFRKADYFIEDFNKNTGEQIAALLTNKNVTTYAGEDFEKVILHYYSVTAYLMLGRLDEALIEAKRMLQKMQRNSDKYQSKNKYKNDAFAHYLLGLVYDAKGEYNDAFIAYRNAYKIYTNDYSQMFSFKVPEQLKKDLLRTAYLSDLKEELSFFEKEFAISFNKKTDFSRSELVVFWNNGLGPIKDQNSINFSIIPGANGYINIVNHDLGYSFPYYVGDKDDRKDLLDMRFFRISLPEYISRKPIYKNAEVFNNGKSFKFETVENINAIAIKSLEDRMLKELAEACLRMAIKQLAVYKAGKEKKEGLALAASLYGAISEQADTRNWQLLPYEIQFVRIPLTTADSTVSITISGRNNKSEIQNRVIPYMPGKRGLQFNVFQSLDYSGYERN